MKHINMLFYFMEVIYRLIIVLIIILARAIVRFECYITLHVITLYKFALIIINVISFNDISFHSFSSRRRLLIPIQY